MKRRLLITTISILILTSSIVLTLTYVQSSTSSPSYNINRKEIENTISLVTSTMNRVKQTLDYASTQNIAQSIIDMANSSYIMAKQLLILANATLYGKPPALQHSWGNYTLVKMLTLQSLHHFKDSMALLLPTWETTLLTTRLHEVSSSIRRSADLIARMYELVEKAAKEYPNDNFTSINEKLSEATTHLASARANITLYKIDEAEEELIIIRQILDQINTRIREHSISVAVIGKKILDYVDGPLTELECNLQTIALTSGVDISTQISLIDEKMLAAKTLTNQGDVIGAVTTIEEAYRMLSNLEKDLHEVQPH